MKRAAVLIGVNKTGHLPRLHDAVSSAKRMQSWAFNQDMSTDCVILLTDEDRPLAIKSIKDAIKGLVDKATIQQLFVYFAGHGVNIGFNEYWLLSEAPLDPQEAVNVSGSNELARHCGIPHVIFFSDACRTAAEGIQAQAVRGSEIFPNAPKKGLEDHVDLFFASVLGSPAFEIKDPALSASAYRGIYTEALEVALAGRVDSILEWSSESGDTFQVVKTWPLGDYLHEELPRALFKLGLANLTQEPQARITSAPNSWVSRLVGAPPTTPKPSGPIRPSGPKPEPEPPIIPDVRGTRPELTGPAGRIPAGSRSLQGLARDALALALQGPTDKLETLLLSITKIPDLPGAGLFAESARLSRSKFGPTRFETACGFKVKGPKCVAAYGDRTGAEILGPDGDVIRVDRTQEPANVLLIFETDTSVVLPAIPGFVGALSFRDRELMDVSYDPSEGTAQWDDFKHEETEVRALRSVVAAASSLGVFRLDRDKALALARRMQNAKGIDPSLSVYAAYAYYELQQHELLQEMLRFQERRLGFGFFDVALLSKALSKDAASFNSFLPGFPLLSQGWALLNALGADPSGSLSELGQYTVPSVWTQFDQIGTSKLAEKFGAVAVVR